MSPDVADWVDWDTGGTPKTSRGWDDDWASSGGGGGAAWGAGGRDGSPALPRPLASSRWHPRYSPGGGPSDGGGGPGDGWSTSAPNDGFRLGGGSGGGGAGGFGQGWGAGGSSGSRGAGSAAGGAMVNDYLVAYQSREESGPSPASRAGKVVVAAALFIGLSFHSVLAGLGLAATTVKPQWAVRAPPT